MHTSLTGLPTFSSEDLQLLFPEPLPKALANSPEVLAAKEAVAEIDCSWMEDVHADLSDLRELIGDSADTVFTAIQNKGEHLRDKLTEFIEAGHEVNEKLIIPPWNKCVPGWQRITPKSAVVPLKKLPKFDIGYFDSETFVKRNQTPIIGQLLTERGLYLWFNPGLWDESKYESFIPLESDLPNNESIILIAHNSGFDAALVSGTFTGSVRWLDTYSMSVATIKKTDRDLGTLHHRFTGTGLSKDTRKLFANMNHADDLISDPDVWHETLRYSIGDLNPLTVVCKNLWPMYLANRPSAVSILGHTYISAQTLPINPEVNKKLAEDFDSEINKLGDQVKAIILKCAEKNLEIGPTHWTRNLDWALVAEKGPGSRKYKAWCGLPMWYADIQHGLKMRKGDSITNATAKYTCLMMLYETQTKLPISMATTSSLGIGRRVILHEFYKSSKNPSELGYISSTFGKEQNVISIIGSLLLSKEEIDLLRVWGEFSRQVGWLRQILFNARFEHNGLHAIGAGVAPHATLSGRTGKGMPTLVKSSSEKHLPFSETRNRISCPSGYRFVGADFDSQENVAGALGGESAFLDDKMPRPIGTTPYGRACYAGTKALETDYHSSIGKLLQTPREPAKVLNLGSVYGMGVKKLAFSLLGATDIDDYDEAEKLATKAKKIKDGRKGPDELLHGGFESDYKNMIQKWVNQPGPEICEPTLGTRPPQDFATKDNNKHKLQNFYSQGGCAASLNVFVTVFYDLCERRGYDHSDAHIVMTVHDEIVAVCREEISIDIAKIFQWTHLLTWTYMHRKLGLYEICLGAAWFETVAIDTHWRKNPSDPCITPTNPAPGFPLGTEYTMAELYAV